MVFVVDAKAGVTPGDEEVADILRRSGKPVLVVANKVDDPSRDDEALEFHRLGLGDPLPISALHGHGTGTCSTRSSRSSRARDGPGRGGGHPRRRLGRPNVGKSSLVNALVGQERVIVSDQPGTTRDSIDTVLRRGDTTFVLVDTAGLRRKRRHRQGIDYSELRAIKAAERADVALVLVDSTEGLVDQDLAVADVARTAGDSTWSSSRSGTLPRWGSRTCSRASRAGCASARPSSRSRRRRIGASASFSTASRSSSPSTGARADGGPEPDPAGAARCAPGRAGTEAPEPALRHAGLHAPAALPDPRERPGLLTRDYGYWVENQLRDRLGLEGVPVIIDFVRRS